jgi:hypothetical protein
MLVEHAQGQSKPSPVNERKKIIPYIALIIYEINFNITFVFLTHAVTIP